MAVIGQWDISDLYFSALPKCLSNGPDGQADITSGTFILYYGSAIQFTATITNGSPTAGYIASSGALVNDATMHLLTNTDFVHTNTDAFSYEFYINYTDGAANQGLCGEFQNSSNFWACRILNDSRLDFIFRKSGTIDRAVSVDTLTDGWNHIVFVKKADGTLEIWINGAEANYNPQDTYALGTTDITSKYHIFEDARSSDYFVGDLEALSVYEAAISPARIMKNTGLDSDYGRLRGTDNGDDTMNLDAPASDYGQTNEGFEKVDLTCSLGY